MSFARKAAKEGFWFTAIKFGTQMITWVFTIYVLRLLRPEDYGLMAMAAFLTAYMEEFSELGLGAAIIQKANPTEDELSCIFWLSMGVGLVLSIATFFLAYPTAWIFRNTKVIPVTQLISILFFIGSLMIVPYNKLVRECRFKALGIINLLSAVTASITMILLARAGYGVFTLIIGTITLRAVRVSLTTIVARWKPLFLINFTKTKPFIKFGVNVAASRSIYRIFESLDKFIVGRLYNAQSLGNYSIAMQLAKIPNDKLISVINETSFPVFAKYQQEHEKIQDMYLRITKYISLIMIPLFFGGFFMADQIILVILGAKWIASTQMFRLFCITQLIVSITSINGIVHNAQGRPSWGLHFNLINSAVMTISIYIAARSGYQYLAIPWVTIYPVFSVIWTFLTLKKIQIPISKYLKMFFIPLVGTCLMIGGIIGSQMITTKTQFLAENVKTAFTLNILAVASIYLIYIFIMEKKTLTDVWKLLKT